MKYSPANPVPQYMTAILPLVSPFPKREGGQGVRYRVGILALLLFLAAGVAHAQDRLKALPGYAQYRTPVKNLYLCGSSTHPGGGVMGAPGANAAREILSDLGRSH